MTMTLAGTVGNTPLVGIRNSWKHPRVRILAKLEGHNPGGSVKDRAALSMLNGAMERGELRPGDRIVEATSGNTGIALAMMARLLGLRTTLVMPDNSTEERVLTMRAFGADVVLTPAERTIEHSRAVAEGLRDEHGWVMLDQFANPDNWGAHYRGTGPEILRDTRGEVTHFVSAMGTTGTIMGVSRCLKEAKPGVTIVGTRPTEGSSIPGIRRWSPEFLPRIFEAARVDRTIDVSEAQAADAARRLAREEAIFSGMSAGGAFHAALEVARELDEGTIVFIACDRGDRYLSSDLFRAGA